MKKYLSLLAALMLACNMGVFTSCSSDEEEELIDEAQIEQFKKDIVGYWLLDKADATGTVWSWRFDAQGNGSYAYGENWDSVESSEGAIGTNKFQWSIDKNGLMVIIKRENENVYDTPDPDAPYVIKSITATKMYWVTSGNEQQSLTRKTTK